MSGSESPVSRQLRDKLRKDRIASHSERTVRTTEELEHKHYVGWRWKRLYKGQMRSLAERNKALDHEEHVIRYTQGAHPHFKRKVSLPKLKFLEAADVPQA